MRESLTASQHLQNTIKADIAKRTKIHQVKVASLNTAQAALRAAGAPMPVAPLIMLAHGDSWFDYPLDGNTPLPFSEPWPPRTGPMNCTPYRTGSSPSLRDSSLHFEENSGESRRNGYAFFESYPWLLILIILDLAANSKKRFTTAG